MTEQEVSTIALSPEFSFRVMPAVVAPFGALGAILVLKKKESLRAVPIVYQVANLILWYSADTTCLSQSNQTNM